MGNGCFLFKGFGFGAADFEDLMRPYPIDNPKISYNSHQGFQLAHIRHDVHGVASMSRHQQLSYSDNLFFLGIGFCSFVMLVKF
jgi:hypothetical protein